MLIIQKYGGATLETPEKIKSAALRIAKTKNNGQQVVAIVSAMGQTTNQLLALSQQVSKRPLLRELDMLLSVGERISMSLISMALNDLNHQAISLTGSQAGIFTDDAHVNAMIKDIKAHRVTEALQENKIVIIAGFQGVSPKTKEITTLGRGGTDTTAVAMASFLKADRCEILKDVPSIFSADPKLVKQAKPINKLNYLILLEMTYWGAKVLHYRSVELACMNKVKLYVGPATENSDDTTQGTIIQEDIMFESTKPIAVNSHQSVFAISIKNKNQSEAIELLNEDFKRNQIGTPQILFGINSNENKILLFVTAPQEIMTMIKDLCSKNENLKIENENLCSVSLTCTGSSLNDVLNQCQKKLALENIQPKYFMQSAMSLNFFIDSDKKSQAIQALHSLI
jgi:aspartate kinase